MAALPASARDRAGGTASGNAVVTEPAPVSPLSVQPPGRPSQTLFSIGGLRVQVWSPVSPPYNAAATYQTFGGQPMTGRDAFLAETVPHPPSG
jgi:hypothetical protein